MEKLTDDAILDQIFGTSPSNTYLEEDASANKLSPELLMTLKQIEFDALSLAEQHKYEESAAKFTKAIELCPSYGSAYNNRGQVYRLMNKTEDALRDIEHALKYGGAEILKQAYTQRGLIRRDCGNTKEAEDDFRMGAKYGNKFAKAVVRSNPYAQLCNDIVSIAMSELNGGHHC